MKNVFLEPFSSYYYFETSKIRKQKSIIEMQFKLSVSVANTKYSISIVHDVNSKCYLFVS